MNFHGPWGFWSFPILNTLFPGGVVPIPDYAYPSTVNFSINTTLVITYSGKTPTSIKIVEASIIV